MTILYATIYDLYYKSKSRKLEQQKKNQFNSEPNTERHRRFHDNLAFIDRMVVRRS